MRERPHVGITRAVNFGILLQCLLRRARASSNNPLYTIEAPLHPMHRASAEKREYGGVEGGRGDQAKSDALNEEPLALAPTSKPHKGMEDSLTRYLFLDAGVGKRLLII